ncbi:MAG TPA: outer membrane beta-barrel protein [Allosphingosinicella sp.]|jgi:outer membrane immunogenic protein
MFKGSNAWFQAGAIAAAATAFPAAAPAQDGTAGWSGPYVGGRLGYAFQPKDRNETILFDTDLNGSFGDTVNTTTGANAFSPGFCGGRALDRTPAAGCAGDTDGTDWAVHAGYDMDLGGIVAGVVADYGRTHVEDSVAAFSTTPAFYTMTRHMRDNASIRARVGAALGETLFYGTGGLAWGKVRNRFATSNTANTFTNSGNEDAWGYRYGGGVEHRVAPNFSVGFQYLYTSLKDDDFRVRAQGPAPATNPFILKNAGGTDFARSGERFNWHSAHVSVNFRF